MAVTFKTITPNLVVSNIARSADFYREALGFQTVATVPAQAPFAFIMLARDGLNLFLNSREATHEEGHAIEPVAGGVTMYIDVTDIGRLWKDMQARAPIVMPLKKQFYGVTEFSVTDPDGYWITFAERVD